MTISSDQTQAAAQALAEDLAFTVPITFDGPHGWLAVAEKALNAAEGARS